MPHDTIANIGENRAKDICDLFSRLHQAHGLPDVVIFRQVLDVSVDLSTRIGRRAHVALGAFLRNVRAGEDPAPGDRVGRDVRRVVEYAEKLLARLDTTPCDAADPDPTGTTEIACIPADAMPAFLVPQGTHPELAELDFSAVIS